MNDTQKFTVHWLTEAEIPLANKFYRTHKFRGKAKRHDPCAVVRDQQNQIIACGSLRQLEGCQLLVGVAVTPEFQGQGLARLLLSFMEEKYNDQTYTFPYQYLMPFYRSLGFEDANEDKCLGAVIGLFQSYQRQGRNILVMKFNQ